MSKSELYRVTTARSRLSRQIRAGVVISSTDRVCRVFRDRSRHSDLWVSDRPDLFGELRGEEARDSKHRLLLLGATARPHRLDFLRSWFRQVEVYADDSDGREWLPPGELLDVLSSEHPSEHVIRVSVDSDDGAVILLRGNLERLVVPMEWFSRDEPAVQPDLSRPRIVDHGQTLEFGDYDAAVDAILYEFDPEVRRAQKERALERDDSLGASLRRLRLQKGLDQSDFAPVSARQIRRIEKGETKAPRGETLEVIGDRLGVEPEEIPSY